MWGMGVPDPQDPCDDLDGDGEPDGCWIEHRWYSWGEDMMCMAGGLAKTSIPPCSTEAWADPDGNIAWSGFYGDKDVAGPRYYNVGGSSVPPTSVGCRVLGQELDDYFGTAVGSDGTWLYISAPGHTALQEDIPSLPADRADAGVVYQLRTDAHVAGQVNLAQLWIEPGFREIPPENQNDPPTYEQITWPHVDAEIPDRTDYTMPVPHQYIIETVGSTRGNYTGLSENSERDFGDCPGSTLASIVSQLGYDWGTTNGNTVIYDKIMSLATEANGYFPYVSDTAGYRMDRTPQIVGPHDGAQVSFVHGLGDVDDDGIADFAVGSANVKEPDPTDPDFGSEVGAIYIVSGRPVGFEGDYLLENLALPETDVFRLHGLMLKGSSAGETLGRVFDNAGDFNGDGLTDVIVGNEAAPDAGEAIVIFGSADLTSPVHGWTVDGIVDANAAIRFVGADAGDLTGTTVAGAGDMDGDGYGDIMISAPGADGGKGAVYLIYGSADMSGTHNLANIGTVDLPGVKFLGRSLGDALGGGAKVVASTHPSGGDTIAHSRGVSALGDIDGDGKDDIAISAMLADPDQREDAGEVYIIYGQGN